MQENKLICVSALQGYALVALFRRGGLAALLLVLTALGCLTATAQQAVVTLDRDQILIGEQVTLQLKVENLTDQAQEVKTWFKVEDTTGHIQVVRAGTMDTISVDGQTTLMQKLTVTSFDSGSWLIPVTNPVVVDINHQEYDLNTAAVYLQVQPVDVSQLKDYHPMKEIIPVDYKDYSWLYITAGAIIVVLLIILLIWWLKKRAKRPKPTKPVVKGPPLAWAMGQIDHLEKEGLVEAGKFKEFYTRLLDICRAYFDERLSNHAFQATSKELVDQLQDYLVRHQERIDLESFAQLSDFVKFAEHSPEVEKTKEALHTARQTLNSVEKQILETQLKK